MICDARDGVTAQDLRIAELAMQEGCATLLALNKWDLAPLTEDDLDHERAKVTRKLRLRPKVTTPPAPRGLRHARACPPRRSRSATGAASGSRRPG